jgi:hypothetical protein
MSAGDDWWKQQLGPVGDQRRRQAAGARAMRKRPKESRLVEVICDSCPDPRPLVAIVETVQPRIHRLLTGTIERFFAGAEEIAGVVGLDGDFQMLGVVDANAVVCLCRTNVLRLDWLAIHAEALRTQPGKPKKMYVNHRTNSVR